MPSVMFLERRLIGMALVVLSEAKDVMVAPRLRFARDATRPSISSAHARASAVRPDRARPVEDWRPDRRSLVRHHLSRRLRPVPLPGCAAGTPAAVRVARLESP